MGVMGDKNERTSSRGAVDASTVGGAGIRYVKFVVEAS